MVPNSIAILPSAPSKKRNRDTEYAYRQDSDFYYLVAFRSRRGAGFGARAGARQAILFCKEKDPEFERWNGELIGQEKAVSEYLFDDSFPIADIDDILPGLLEGKRRVYYSMGLDEKFDRHLMDWINQIRGKVRSGAHPPGEFVALEHTLHDMRLYKSPAEIKVMRKAAQISAEAHVLAMQHCRPGMYEYQIEGVLLGEFSAPGRPLSRLFINCWRGANACVLHYVENNAKLNKGDLLLIDAGCELDNYASDITRTFPVSGKSLRHNRHFMRWCWQRRRQPSKSPCLAITGITRTKQR